MFEKVSKIMNNMHNIENYSVFFEGMITIEAFTFLKECIIEYALVTSLTLLFIDCINLHCLWKV